ncbi:MAG: rhamnosidase [Streptosporangiaceae bacterium]|nr:rhamnosidase [Streptosporangiaceae bacterium]
MRLVRFQRPLVIPAITAITLAGLAPFPASASPGGGVRILETTTEYAEHPLGLDTAHPRLGWVLGSAGRGQGQSAYEVRVASASGRLGSPDVWESGKVTSAQSTLVPYGGPALKSRTRYHWAVRVWDTRGRPSPWSNPSWWEMGLPAGADWQAGWIGPSAQATQPPDLTGTSWIWFPEGDPASNAPVGTRYFRGSFDLAAGLSTGTDRARLVLTADDGFTAWVNGTEVGARDSDPALENWRHPILVDVTDKLRQGHNTIAVQATNGKESPAGLLGRLELTTSAGVRNVDTSGDWRSLDREPAGDWRSPGYDDAAWPAAKVLTAWGGSPWGRVQPEAPVAPAPLLRRGFRLAAKPVRRARLYSTALGLYEAQINGRRVGDDRLAPGWTDYRTRVQYQTYDVTRMLRAGNNAIGVTVAPGWYAGNVGMFGPKQYGDRPWLKAELEVEYADGTTDRVVTDDAWRSTTGPVVAADLLMGESYDARREPAGWTAPGFDDASWQPVLKGQGITARPVAQVDAPVRVERELRPVKVTEPKPGVHVFDLGQNMVGTVRLRVSGEAGRTVTLRHAEVLNKDGTIYTDNLRSARATDTYTLRGGGTETYEPQFTFHGFRYVEVTGYPGTPPQDAVVGRVMHTAAPFTMSFDTDVPMMNQLHHNITWGQRGNFLSIPTDTPARDERLGWTGDINVFAPTAAYNMESARFLTKWLQDLRDVQTSDGAFTDVAPLGERLGSGSAGWGDAGVTVPWSLYQAYGDRQVLEQSYPAMTRWISYLERNSTGHLRPAAGFGDWLNVADETPKDVIATAYFAYSTGLVAKTARALGKEDEARHYDELFGQIRDAFDRAYVSGDGRVKGDTQTAYVLALSMDLLPDSARGPAADRLVQLIQAKDWHLSTGFLGTPRLLPVLTATGHTDVAYRLLQQRTFPSWGYQIDKGATTMWERWDSIKPDGSFQDKGMNSFNHYAYGSVGEWMYQNITGISAGEPGYRRVVIRPRPGGDVHRASGRYDSVYGPITTRWEVRDGRFTLDVSVPVNTTAEVWVPAASAGAVTEGGRKATTATGVRFVRTQDGNAVFTVGSGSYRFSAAQAG